MAAGVVGDTTMAGMVVVDMTMVDSTVAGMVTAEVIDLGYLHELHVAATRNMCPHDSHHHSCCADYNHRHSGCHNFHGRYILRGLFFQT